ncbi:MAG: hypothetical protein IKM68_08675 [Bacteroidaceae bacterium]|nr:hypothetical protein [Bacteroidaceae bacterium]
MTLYVFNPENDMALADGHPGYTPPVQIQQMRRELWWLPQWWADEEDIVWNGEERLNLSDDTRILPWGWSPSLCHQLKQAGVQESLLPSRKELEQIRQLSHRQTAVSLLQELRSELPLDGHFAGNSVLCRSIEEAEETANAFGEALLKSPWSSSGRGLMKTDNPQWKAWASRILKAQGSVVVEKFLHKVTDFALEFWLDGKGGVEYRGLSLFYTNERGAYLGNWVAPEEQKLAWLAQYIPLQYLQEIRAWWTARLSRFDYAGPVGIDMMLAQEGICPCIEVNWRWTMGLVSCLVAEQGRYGRMVVEYIYGHYSAEVEAFS